MTEFSERSGIFKFLYIFLRIITFPIFLILFIFRHPIWLLLVLLMIAGGAVYWPMSQGVKTEELLDWYQKKFVVVKKDVVKAAKEKGMTNLVPQAIVEEVEQMEDPDIAAGEPRSENYNVKVVRDAKSKETKHILKKRGGFKKAAVVEEVKVEKNLEDMTDKEILEESGGKGGGLAKLLAPSTHNEVSDEAPAEIDENTEAVVEKTSENVATDEQNAEPETIEDIIEEVEEESAEQAPAAEEPKVNLMPKEETEPKIDDEPDIDLF